MLSVYLFSLVFGGVLLGVSVFFGDGNAHGEGVDLEANSHGDVHGTVDGFVSILASVRFWTFFTAFFGACGAIMTHFGFANTVVTLAVSLMMGGGIGLTVAKIFRYLQTSQSNSLASSTRFVGQIAKVTVSVSKDKLGQVRLMTATGPRDLLATTPTGDLYAEGADVRILKIADAKAVVARPDLTVDEEVALAAAEKLS
jgi:hypothetical protein